MHPRALIRLALATSICFAFACDDKKDANETNAKAKTGADTKTGPDEPKGGEPSAFFSDELDDLPMPDPGRFRLEVGGEVFEGPLSAGCKWMSSDDEGSKQDRLSFSSARWTTEDGRAIEISATRFVSMDDFSWNLSHGHERDRIQLRLRADGNQSRLTDLGDTASSELNIMRPRPGADVVARTGKGTLPVIKVAADRSRATAVGELTADGNRDAALGTPLTGAFSLAVRCPE